eukprot:SAG22_NODE_915_length_6508_cov_11.991730_3_plen_246_part_00
MLVIALAAMVTTVTGQFCEGSPTQLCRMSCPAPSCTSTQCAMRAGTCCDITCQEIGSATAEATVDCPDTDGNGVVDVSDVLGTLSAFGGSDAQADLDNNGLVDVNDMLATLSAFGTECSASSTPPPPPTQEPAPPPPCANGEDCGGQEVTSCGTMCPPICGSPVASFCVFSCFSGYQCPSDNRVFDPDQGRCVASMDCCGNPDPTCSGSTGGGTGGSLPPGLALGRPFTTLRPAPTVAGLVEGSW